MLYVSCPASNHDGEAHEGAKAAGSRSPDIVLPGLRLHPLKGDQAGRWAVSVSGNWRVTFDFTGEDVTEVDHEDYH